MPEIKGYRTLTAAEIERVNEIKDAEYEIGELWRELQLRCEVDKRWTAIAKTHFQEGFTALVRSITRPEDVF